jgi:hypothetical protein
MTSAAEVGLPPQYSSSTTILVLNFVTLPAVFFSAVRSSRRVLIYQLLLDTQGSSSLLSRHRTLVAEQ